MANGNGLTGATIDLASKMIVQVGFPVVVAAVLLWFLLTKFQDNMLVITDRMAKNTEAASSMISHQAALLKAEENVLVELKTQSTDLRGQSTTLAQIAKDSAELVENRKEELQLLKDRMRKP